MSPTPLPPNALTFTSAADIERAHHRESMAAAIAASLIIGWQRRGTAPEVLAMEPARLVDDAVTITDALLARLRAPARATTLTHQHP